MKCILPCPRCRLNYIKHLESLEPLTVKNAERWIYDLHNRVNGDKAQAPPEFRDVITKMRKSPAWHPRDYMIFLEAIVESHPGGNAITESQIECLRNFWQAIAGPVGARAHVESRTKMRELLIYLKNKWGVTSKLMGMKRKCHTDVCVL